MSMNVSKIVTIWYAGFAIIAEEMLFLHTAFVFVWTIMGKQSFRAIKLSLVTEWRKGVSNIIIHLFWNTSPSYCFPKTKIMAKIKFEINAENSKVITKLDLAGL